jgi:hypothetical protein
MTAEVQTPGEVQIVDVLLSKNAGTKQINLVLFTVEINIYEDIMRNGMYGTILIADAANIAGLFPITGAEMLKIAFKTPGMEEGFNDEFQVYSISDKIMLKDTGTQGYILHFVIPELMTDVQTPVWGTWSGYPLGIADMIFKTYFSDKKTLNRIGADAAEVTFTSPGWRPSKAINWLASRSVPFGQGDLPGALFFQSSKSYHLVNYSTLLRSSADFGEYTYIPANLSGTTDGNFVKDVQAEYFKIENMEVKETYNGLKNLHSGFYANRLLTLDIMKKSYEVTEYDHISSFQSRPKLNPFPSYPDILNRNPATVLTVYPQLSDMYGKPGERPPGVSMTVKGSLGAGRISAILELDNFKIEITVPGRTDIEVGRTIKLYVPDSSPRDEGDTSDRREDKVYSGRYLITAIRHKLTLQKHMMIMEIVKESTLQDYNK